jgi:hypothetical protein
MKKIFTKIRKFFSDILLGFKMAEEYKNKHSQWGKF